MTRQHIGFGIKYIRATREAFGWSWNEDLMNKSSLDGTSIERYKWTKDDNLVAIIISFNQRTATPNPSSIPFILALIIL
ncbi:hypothetical protein CEXT_404691 [Caerostris extrusa]|uniref:Uncharacterized protein n=1 Tax=Caerostris extrusa TaxID=172846 RepID=A0AAV4TCH3_CAEEX|nr:hypothetical protein CEXT_404691 [Caerostris extrusa]